MSDVQLLHGLLVGWSNESRDEVTLLRVTRPLRRSASIAAISSPVSVNPRTSRFVAIRSGVVDFGMTTTSCWTCQRSTTCAGVTPWASRRGGVSADGAQVRALERAVPLDDDAALAVGGQQVRVVVARAVRDLVHGRGLARWRR